MVGTTCLWGLNSETVQAIPNRAIRRRINGRGASSSMTRGGLTGDGGRGSASSSELRRSSEMCAGTVSSTRRRLEAVASPEVVSFAGVLRVLAAAASLQFERWRGYSIKLKWRGELW